MNRVTSTSGGWLCGDSSSGWRMTWWRRQRLSAGRDERFWRYNPQNPGSIFEWGWEWGNAVSGKIWKAYTQWQPMAFLDTTNTNWLQWSIGTLWRFVIQMLRARCWRYKSCFLPFFASSLHQAPSCHTWGICYVPSSLRYQAWSDTSAARPCAFSIWQASGLGDIRLVFKLTICNQPTKES